MSGAVVGVVRGTRLVPFPRWAVGGSLDACLLRVARNQVARAERAHHAQIAFFWRAECRLIAARLIGRGC